LVTGETDGTYKSHVRRNDYRQLAIRVESFNFDYCFKFFL